MGYEHPDMLRPSDIYRRFDQGLMHFDEIYTPLEIGQLLTNDIPRTYAADWQKHQRSIFKLCIMADRIVGLRSAHNPVIT